MCQEFTFLSHPAGTVGFMSIIVTAVAIIWGGSTLGVLGIFAAEHRNR